MNFENQSDQDALSILKRSDFGRNFNWGVAVSAYQNEGSYNCEGKGLSIWDNFSNLKGKIFQNQNGNNACDFYKKFDSDLLLLKQLNIPNFRFSLSWSRLLPDGTGTVNKRGIDFYHKLIDKCLELDIQPWITLYHWDLPLALEKKGGWTNRDIIGWFSDYTELVTKSYCDKVKHWMVLNEPMVFTGAGYFLGIHAPGRKGLKSFLPAVHHAAMCQAEGGRILKELAPDSEVGTTFSCSYIEPYRQNERDRKAATRVDALLNRLFIEPALGLGYPFQDIRLLSRMEKYIKQGDYEKLSFSFDFIGIQNYTREIIKHSLFTPFINAKIISAKDRKVPTTLMNWEVYPPAIYQMLKKYAAYSGIKKIIVSENGAAFPDKLENGAINDSERKHYIIENISQVKRAQMEGVNVQGYFIWTFTDNFEWAEGYMPRFGIVYVDFENQERTVKSSGNWYKQFLSD